MASLYSILALLATGIPVLAAGDFRDPNLPIDARVSDLVSRLTLQEKISLMASTQPAVPRLGIEGRNVGSEALQPDWRTPGTPISFARSDRRSATNSACTTTTPT